MWSLLIFSPLIFSPNKMVLPYNKMNTQKKIWSQIYYFYQGRWGGSTFYYMFLNCIKGQLDK